MHPGATTPRRGRLLALLLAGLLAGCATRPAPHGGDIAPPGACAAWLEAAQRAVAAAGVRDVQATRVPGHPELRVDRLLAVLAAERPSGAAFAAWVDRAAALAREGWAAELANLPAAARAGLVDGDAPAQLLARAETCLAERAAVTRADGAGREALLAGARVPDAYVDWQRVVGLYPLTRWGVLAGYFRWRDELDAAYARPLAELPVHGELRRYAAPGWTAPAPSAGWRTDALGYPRLDAAARGALFAAHAPLWEIDTSGAHDLPGAPAWPEGAWRVALDTARPAEYRHLGYTRVAGTILPQLSYLLWFPARPPEREGDIYAGHLDGLLLRVTLGADGRPLLYDSIHPCGCYHLFFPGPRLRPRPDGADAGEGFHAPQAAPAVGAGERLAVRVAARSHQLLRLHAVPSATPAATLAARDYATLRSLPRGTGRRSLFGEDGLVAGTRRTERFLLWPMGVPSAGALRQWGHHATAFVGRRHFDDPGLVEAGFEVAAGR